MTETVKVNPTPIQRNTFDVAIELLDMYRNTYGFGSHEEIETLFAKYYAVAEFCNRKTAKDLQKLVPEEILGKVGKFQSTGW